MFPGGCTPARTRERPARVASLKLALKRNYVAGLGTFLALHLGKLDLLAIFQRPMAFTDDVTEVDEKVFAAFALDKTKPFATVEPFDRSGLSF